MTKLLALMFGVFAMFVAIPQASAADTKTDAQLVTEFVTLFPASVPGPWIPDRSGGITINRAGGFIRMTMINTKTGKRQAFTATLRTITNRNGTTTTSVIPPMRVS